MTTDLPPFDGDNVAAAVVSRSTGAPVPRGFYELRTRVWAEPDPELTTWGLYRPDEAS